MVTIDKLNNWPHSLRSVLRSFLSAFISTVHHCQILLTQKPSSSHVKQSSLKQLPFFLSFFFLSVCLRGLGKSSAPSHTVHIIPVLFQPYYPEEITQEQASLTKSRLLCAAAITLLC